MALTRLEKVTHKRFAIAEGLEQYEHDQADERADQADLDDAMMEALYSEALEEHNRFNQERRAWDAFLWGDEPDSYDDYPDPFEFVMRDSEQQFLKDLLGPVDHSDEFYRGGRY